MQAQYSIVAPFLRLYFNRCTPTPGKNWSIDLGPDTVEMLFHDVQVKALSGTTRFVPSNNEPKAWLEFRDVVLYVEGVDGIISEKPFFLGQEQAQVGGL